MKKKLIICIIVISWMVMSSIIVSKAFSSEEKNITDIVGQQYITIPAIQMWHDHDKNGKPEVTCIYVWNDINRRLIKISCTDIEE